MRKILAFAALVAFAAFSGSCAKEKENIYPDPVNPSPANPDNPKNPSGHSLPATAQTFLNTHFPGTTVAKLKAETHGSGGAIEKYEVDLSDGTELEFDPSGKCVKIKRKSRIPDSALPASIVAYVNSHFPGAFIKEWELDGHEQEVKLSNGTKIIFDLNGNFIEIDD